MTSLAAPFATFLFFSGFVAAQIYAPVCTVASTWMLNSLDQNPCLVTANLMATCNDGSFTINPLPPGSGYKYPGPTDILQFSDLCMCNTVTYSLISACGACQGGIWVSWSEYSLNCTTTLPPSSFPNPLPLGIRVPRWALIDVTSENNWDSNKSFAVGDLPEPTPGAILGSSTATFSLPRSSSTSSLFGEPTSTANPAEGASSSTSSGNTTTDIIVAASVGGMVVIAFVILISLLVRQRRRPKAPVPVAPPVFGASQPPMDEIQRPLTMENGYITSSTSIPGTVGTSLHGTPVAPMRNDPNYPSTFPEYQGVPQTPTSPPEGAVPSSNTTGNTLATTQTSLQQGYHGLPTV